MDDAEMAMLLEHYERNVLESPLEASPKIGALENMLETDPENFRKTIVEGMNNYKHLVKEVYDSDIEGAMFVFDEDFSILGIKVEDDKHIPMMEKVNAGAALGGTLLKKSFNEGSHLYGINVVFFSGLANYKHERSHVRHGELGVPTNNILECEPSTAMDFVKSRYAIAEIFMLGEILAYDGRMSSGERTRYPKEYANAVTEELDGCDIISLLGSDKTSFKSELSVYFAKRFDKAIEAYNSLKDCADKDILERIVISCGPAKAELSTGEYVQPFDEIAMWAEHKDKLLPRLEKNAYATLQ